MSYQTTHADYLARKQYITATEHPRPFRPLTKADITDEMTKAMQTALFADGIDDRDIMVFAVNIYIEKATFVE